MKTLLKILFKKKDFIDDLCEMYGNPYDVLWYLQQLADKSSIFAELLKKEIDYFKKEVDQWYAYEKEKELQEYYPSGGCYDCPWGNGEGGCTIPGYCPSN